MKFTYVYIIQSERWPDRFYSGITDNLKKRLLHHNDGCCDYTRPFKPWRVKTALAFSDHLQARKFEQYLKSPSGRAFARKRL